MKLSIFSMNRPTNPPSGALPPDEPPVDLVRDTETQSIVTPQELRLQVLERILRASSVLGVLILAANIPSLGTESPLRVGIYAALVGLLLVCNFTPRLGYALRAIGLTLVIYFVSGVILLSDGPFGVGSILLITIPIFASLLGGARSRALGLVASLGTLVVIGLLMGYEVIPTPLPNMTTQNARLVYWATLVITFMLVTVAATIASGLILEGLEHSMARQNALTLALRRERTALEERVQQRTQSLERRQLQIRTAAELVRAISRELDINQLLPQVCELVRQRLDLYYVGVFLVEDARPGQARYATLAAGSGEAGRRMLAEKHRLLVGGDSMIGWATANRQARIALDVGKEAAHFNNPHLPRTRSELALPIMAGQNAGELTAGQTGAQAAQPIWGQGRQYQAGTDNTGRIIGALTIQSEAEAAFDQDDVLMLQGIADALASALENARLFAATQASLEEVRALHQRYLEGAWAEQIEARGEMAYTFQPEGQAAKAPAGDVLEVPLHLRDEVIGSLALEPATPGHPWTDREKALVEAVAVQAALALENARLLEETSRRAEQERATGEITGKLWTSSDIDAILRTFLKEMGSQLNLSEGWLELWPADEASPAAAAHPLQPFSPEASHADN